MPETRPQVDKGPKKAVRARAVAAKVSQEVPDRPVNAKPAKQQQQQQPEAALQEPRRPLPTLGQFGPGVFAEQIKEPEPVAAAPWASVKPPAGGSRCLS